jgi:hypothetical protein
MTVCRIVQGHGEELLLLEFIISTQMEMVLEQVLPVFIAVLLSHLDMLQTILTLSQTAPQMIRMIVVYVVVIIVPVQTVRVLQMVVAY